ncbi:MAG: hypothetical protein IPH83_04295 [Gammaproteobacteria bacterium]|nr:hypothetical protein [Gammaproteobacteria bacterium]
MYRAIVHLRANRADLEVFVLDTDHGVGIVRRGAPLSTVEIDIERIAALDFAEFAARREYWLELRPVSFRRMAGAARRARLSAQSRNRIHVLAAWTSPMPSV